LNILNHALYLGRNIAIDILSCGLLGIESDLIKTFSDYWLPPA